MQLKKLSLYPIILFTLCTFSVDAQINGFHIKWEREKLAPGLIWKSTHTMIDDTVPQNINLLIVNTLKRKLSIIYNAAINIKTSTQATETDAIAAINAGFFNVKDGGSVTYIKVNGKVTESDTATRWKRVPNMNGSVIINSSGAVEIMKALSNSAYDSNGNYRDVLITGPLLLLDGKRNPLPETSLVINKHPRSGIGLINAHKIVLITLDGRTHEATGMTLVGFTELMISLKCRDAVNLDGGGSTTMWIRGKPFDGVVNMPCDNKLFDHEGERSVSDIFIVK